MTQFAASRSARAFCRAVAALVGVLVLAGALSAAQGGEPRTVTIRDWTGRGFAPDLVNYTISAPADAGAGLRVRDGSGTPIPVQIAPGEKGQATLSFVAAVEPNGVATYSVRTDGGPAAEPAVSATSGGQALVLANQLLAVRVPAPRETTFDKPVPADTLPAPMLAFRGGDGAWRGAGTILSKRAVKKIRVAQVAGGPVFVEILYRLDYAEGGYYEARVRVTDRSPLAQVSEEYDLGADTNANYWQLDLSKGWQADEAERMSVAGQGFSPVVYPSLAEEEKAVAAGPNIGADFSGGGARPARCIHHDSCWGAKFVSYYGIHSAAARKADPNRYALAMVAPLHKGQWRRANSLPVYIKGGQVTVQFPMDVAPISWRNEPASDVSPFSCHEHDPALPATYGRRVWGLVLAQPALRVVGYGDAKTAGVGYAARVLYGLVGLDRYKDFILDWPFDSAQGGPGGKTVYPRVFLTPAEEKKYRQAVAADPDFPLRKMVQGYYWFTGEANTAKAEVPGVLKRLDENVRYIASALSIHHHHTLGAYGEPIGHTESVLCWPDLPAGDRATIRARLALLCYLLTDPDVTSAGDGSHHGNPNMGISRLMDRSNLAALIPDHPMHKTWADYMGMFMAYKMGTFMAPEGGWFEYGTSYHMHGYGKILRGMMGALADAVAEANRIRAYHLQDFGYFLNLLSPVDPRYGARTIPGAANSPVGNPPHFLQAMGSVADREPAFAANLRWAWENGGRMIATGGDAITLPAMVRPGIVAREPNLTSRTYPGYGVVFRAHQGPDETCLYLRSGYLWSHWNHDQGNLMLYSKGAVLLPPQPYAYGGPKDANFPDKNFVRFGSPSNDLVYAWPDSGILDSHFGPSVDYAWASSGYPDWYVSPGYKTGFGQPRPMVEGLGQKEGAFTWDRQIAFLKGATPRSPSYFVIRDSMNPPPSSRQAPGLASWFNLSLLGRKANVAIEAGKVALDTEWPTKLDMLFPGRDKPAFEMVEDDLSTQLGPYSRILGDAGEVSRDWIAKDGNRAVRDGRGGCNAVREQHVTLRLASAPGQEIAWVLYPRGAGEAAPTATQLAPGVTKVVTAEGTDYVFLSTTPLAWSGEGVEFAGLAGAVRVRQGGKATLALSAGPGKVGYKGVVIDSAVPFEGIVADGDKAQTIPAPATTIQMPATMPGGQPVAQAVAKASAGGVTQYLVDTPAATVAADGEVKLHARKAAVEIGKDSVRFVVPERAYAQLSVGNVGVRGVGPFDLTFTPDGIAGKVDGDIRTLVTTWPEKITRPGYTMDGVRWYAGFADEQSIYKGTATPQFAVAFGVSAGPHEVKIGEWVWPAMPTPPARRRLE